MLVIRSPTSLETPKSTIMNLAATVGADDANVPLTVIKTMTKVTIHFLASVQFCGLVGSSGPSQLSSSGSRSAVTRVIVDIRRVARVIVDIRRVGASNALGPPARESMLKRR